MHHLSSSLRTMPHATNRKFGRLFFLITKCNCIKKRTYIQSIQGHKEGLDKRTAPSTLTHSRKKIYTWRTLKDICSISSNLQRLFNFSPSKMTILSTTALHSKPFSQQKFLANKWEHPSRKMASPIEHQN